jgi:hypothetical protein
MHDHLSPELKSDARRRPNKCWYVIGRPTAKPPWARSKAFPFHDQSLFFFFFSRGYKISLEPISLQVYVPPHPLIKHWVAVMRNKDTPGAIFRAAAAELGRILVYEAVREWLPVIEGEVETPLGATADVTFVDPTQPIKLVPILRAGLILLESAATVLPATETYHIGYVRDDATLEARCYLNKLPDKLTAADRILITDPMMATGECCRRP